jgi:tripartite-type tricarboxylate transporter receptor subunit TctC
LKKIKFSNLLLVLALISIILVGCSSNQNQAQGSSSKDKKLDYPTKSINFIVPFAAGGSTDTVARGIAETAPNIIGQSMVVVNRPGASGTIGTAEGAKAKPDGYTINLVTGTSLAMQPLLKDLNYTIDDFKFISSVVYNPLLLVVDGNSPYDSIQDLIDHAKANDQTLKVGHPGVGTVNDIAHAAFFNSTGIKTSNIPFKANNESIAAIIGGHIDIAAVHPMESSEYLRDGKLKALGIFTPERLDLFPDVPTIGEELTKAGIDSPYNNYDFSAWYYLAVPKETPDEVVNFLRENMKSVLEDESFKKNADNLKMTIRLIEGEEITNQLKEMEKTNETMIKDFGIGKE